MYFDEGGRQKLAAILSEARRTYGRAELERVEEAFAIATGSKKPVGHEDPAQAGTAFFFPGLSAKPWHDKGSFPMCAKLEESWEAIREEMINALQQRRGFQQFRLKETAQPKGSNSGTPRGWKALYLKEHTEEFPDNCKMCPETVKLIADEPRVANYVYFSALDPGEHIGPFYASYSWTFNIQMGLIVPDDCGVRVKEEIRRWEEGKCLAFDASFEHEAWNRGDFTLFILLITTFHPDLTDTEIALLKRSNLDLATQADVAHGAALKQAQKELDGQKWWT